MDTTPTPEAFGADPDAGFEDVIPQGATGDVIEGDGITSETPLGDEENPTPTENSTDDVPIGVPGHTWNDETGWVKDAP